MTRKLLNPDFLVKTLKGRFYDLDPHRDERDLSLPYVPVVLEIDPETKFVTNVAKTLSGITRVYYYHDGIREEGPTFDTSETDVFVVFAVIGYIRNILEES